MKISAQNKTIYSIAISDAETAWRIQDANLVLEYLQDQRKIVLGGDILDKQGKYTYDSWYYNVDSNKNLQFNVEYSYRTSTEYISNYMKANGSAFYVVFVVK